MVDIFKSAIPVKRDLKKLILQEINPYVSKHLNTDKYVRKTKLEQQAALWL